jgi:hypothetical protein
MVLGRVLEDTTEGVLDQFLAFIESKSEEDVQLIRDVLKKKVEITAQIEKRETEVKDTIRGVYTLGKEFLTGDRNPKPGEKS